MEPLECRECGKLQEAGTREAQRDFVLSDICIGCSPKPKRTWYEQIIETVNQIGEEFEITGQQKEKLRDVIVTIAKDQYKLGNKSGIRWARLNPPRETKRV